MNYREGVVYESKIGNFYCLCVLNLPHRTEFLLINKGENKCTLMNSKHLVEFDLEITELKWELNVFE